MEQKKGFKSKFLSECNFVVATEYVDIFGLYV